MKNRLTLLSRRRRGGGSAEWTPSSVSSLAHWYDLNTTGGGYTVDGINITGISDKAGSCDLSPIGTNYATTAGSINSVGCGQFTNDIYYGQTSIDTAFAVEDNPFAFAVVAQKMAGTSQVMYTGLTDADQVRLLGLMQSATNPFVQVIDDADSSVTQYSTESRSNGTPWFCIMNCHGTTVDIYVDGVLDKEAAALNGGARTSLDTVALGGRYNDGTKDRYLSNGRIGEAMLFNDALSASDIAALNSYFATRWGFS